MLMPQGFILLPVLTWCHPYATAPAAVLASSPLLHIMESMVEAVPTSIALWGILYIQASSELGMQKLQRRADSTLGPGQYRIPSRIPPMRRFLWFFTMVSSCSRAVTGVFAWVKANKQGSGSGIRQPFCGLEYMSRKMDPSLPERTLARLMGFIFGTMLGAAVAVAVVSIISRVQLA